MRISKYSKIIENVVIVIYVFFVSFVAYFHEPWFDEAQAWLIARDNNLFDMIWNVLRYEGHTPLWYICLYIPSHLGFPYELSLKAINILFISLAVILIIKTSPFPPYIKLLLPFTYFIFYQYGVISRSYSLLAFILFLIAAYFTKRNDKPFSFVFLLALLGSVTLHGMLIAFGIALAWFIEIIHGYKSTFKNILVVCNDIRFQALSLLGFMNILYVMMLWPMPDKFTYLQQTSFNPLSFLFRLVIVPFNAIALDVNGADPIYSIGMLIIIFVLCSLLIFCFFTWVMKKTLYFYIILPLIFISFFTSLIYFAGHHTGIFLLLIVYSMWISTNSNHVFTSHLFFDKLYDIFIATYNKRTVYKISLKITVALIFCIQFFWTFTASINDVQLPYSEGKQLATFLKNNHIQDRKILNCISLRDDKTPFSVVDISTLPYFTKNIFYNMNFGNTNISYVTHKEYKSEEVLTYLSREGYPDFIVDKYVMSYYYKVINPKDFVPVEIFSGYYMWKNRIASEHYKIYIRKDLLPEYPQFGEIISIEPEKE